MKEGIDIVWQIMVTQKNSTEIDELYKLGRDLEVEKIFITAEHYYVGRVQSFNKMNEFFPRISNLKDVKKEVYQLENGVIKPEKEYIEDLEKNINYKISNVNFNEIYIDKDFNVYPIFHLSSEFLLGNAIDSFDKVRDRILHNKDLPSKMIEKNSLNFIDLIRKYADKDSNELHTPQSLFDKLSTIELQG
ncbi:hypothetical protein [Dethiothermospora halolimnae]|uniref:hypothetical protein n=1 Tax=Dethiothermospora halolimnae TaxID=3114390 RepID=UPI003CCB75B9